MKQHKEKVIQTYLMMDSDTISLMSMTEDLVLKSEGAVYAIGTYHDIPVFLSDLRHHGTAAIADKEGILKFASSDRMAFRVLIVMNDSTTLFVDQFETGRWLLEKIEHAYNRLDAAIEKLIAEHTPPKMEDIFTNESRTEASYCNAKRPEHAKGQDGCTGHARCGAGGVWTHG